MKIIAVTALLATAVAGATVPGEFLVASPRLVAPDAAAGVWYLGDTPAGRLYLATRPGVARLTPYRVLHDDPETASYYFVSDPSGTEAARLAALGVYIPMGERAGLLVMTRGREAALAAAGLKVEIRRLEPIRPAPHVLHADEPPPSFNTEINTALQRITEDRVLGYITDLQNFGTRYSYTQGYQDAAEYVYDFFRNLGYDVKYDRFFGVTFDGVAMATDGNKVWVTTDGGTIYYTANGGTTWQKQEAPAKGFLWSVTFLDENVGHAVGAGATALVTTNGGATWTAQNVPYNGYLFGVSFPDAANGWIVADAGRIFHTTNGGNTWTEQTSPTSSRLYDVAMADATRGWACGRDGVILRTVDGTTWTRQTTNTTQRLYGVYAVSANEGWACGWGKTLLHTTDGGATWNQVAVDPPAFSDFYDVRFPDAAHGFVVGTDGAFLATTDGGATWNYSEVGGHYFMSCDFGTPLVGMLGGTAALYRTSDGGATFESLTDKFSDQWPNVVAEKKGRRYPDEIIIICGHLDCTSEQPLVLAPGAEDNGSGSAAAMAAARALADMDFERTLRFIVWAGEEQGLLGSEHYAQNSADLGEDIVGVVNLDMVAYDEENGQRDDSSDYTNGPSQWLAQYLVDAAHVYNVQHIFDIVLDPFAGGSDHASFWQVGYDAIFLIEGTAGPGGLLSYPYYHTSQDTVDKLRMKLEVDCGRAGTATVAHLGRVYKSPFVLGPAPPGGNAFVVYPNPFRGTPGGTVHFERCPPGAEICVYDLGGRRVFRHTLKAEEDSFEWDATSEGGGVLAPGVYLYRVAGAGRTEKGKLAVIR